jgi:hypothetical protein
MIHKLNKVFVNIHFLHDLTHWLVQRFAAISAFICLTFVSISGSLFIFCVFGSSLIFDTSAGIQTLIDDCIHNHVLF